MGGMSLACSHLDLIATIFSKTNLMTGGPQS